MSVFHEHWGDDELISVLWRKSDRWPAPGPGRHLRRCGLCRDRMQALRDALLTLPDEWEDSDPGHPAATERARQHFVAWARSVRFEAEHTWSYRLVSLLRVPVMTAVCALLLIGGIGVWERLNREPAADVPAPMPHPPAGVARMAASIRPRVPATKGGLNSPRRRPSICPLRRKVCGSPSLNQKSWTWRSGPSCIMPGLPGRADRNRSGDRIAARDHGAWDRRYARAPTAARRPDRVGEARSA